MTRPIRATDASAWFHCRRRAWLDHNPPPGLTMETDRFDALVRAMGDEHERAVRERLGGGVEADSAEHTRELMRDGVALIYQPELDGGDGVVGRPDFAIREPDGRYRMGDAKLARGVDDHPEILAQAGVYRRLAGNALPVRLFLGDGTELDVEAAADEKAEAFLTGLRAALAGHEPPAVAFGESRCSSCPYDVVCRPGFVAADAVSLVYGVDPRSVPRLAELGVTTVADLAASDVDGLPDVPYLKGARLRRAIRQAEAQARGVVVPLAEPVVPPGTHVHFDIEADPLGSAGVQPVYLWGFLLPPHDAAAYRAVWSDALTGTDRQGWLAFLDEVETLRARFPDLVLVHYASYERTQIAAYARRFEMADHPTVRWLLDDDGPLFDLQPAVRAAFALPLTGYGLKAICRDPRLVGFRWSLDESGSQWSVVRYHDYLAEPDAAARAAIRDEIVTYNRDDVRATHALVEWMRARPARG